MLSTTHGAFLFYSSRPGLRESLGKLVIATLSSFVTAKRGLLGLMVGSLVCSGVVSFGVVIMSSRSLVAADIWFSLAACAGAVDSAVRESLRSLTC